MNFRGLFGDLVIIINSSSLLLSTLNSSLTVDEESKAMNPEIIPGVGLIETKKQGTRGYSLSQEMLHMFLD